MNSKNPSQNIQSCIPDSDVSSRKMSERNYSVPHYYPRHICKSKLQAYTSYATSYSVDATSHMLLLNQFLAIYFFKRLWEKVKLSASTNLVNLSCTLPEQANILILCIHLPDTKKNECKCASVCACVWTWFNRKCAFRGSSTVCVCKLFLPAEVTQGKVNNCFISKERMNFVMGCEMHTGKHASSKAHKQPTLAFPFLHIFVVLCIENKRSNILKTCRLTLMHTRK